MQRTLALELQKLSIAFRKQQKQHLNRYVPNGIQFTECVDTLLFRLRTAEGGGNITVMEGKGGGDEFDPGFSEMQVHTP